MCVYTGCTSLFQMVMMTRFAFLSLQGWLVELYQEKVTMETLRNEHWSVDLSCTVDNYKACHISMSLVASDKKGGWSAFDYLAGTPRTAADNYEDAIKYGKRIKTESPPIRAFDGAIGKGKPYEGVSTIKETGRSVHEIPSECQDLCKTADLPDRRVMEGSMPQVWLYIFCRQFN